MSSSPPLPSPPFIPVRGLANLRDAGGYPVTGGAAGRVVRRGVLYRSAAPEGLGLDDGDGVAALRRLGITRVFDLRSVAELAKAGSDGDDDGDGRQGDREKQQQQRLLQLQWEGAERVFAPVFLDKDYSPEALAARFRNYSDGPEGFVRAYEAILEAAAAPDHPHTPFRAILEHLASASAPTPVLVHCTAGKDRTGVAIALILSLVGVDDEAVAHEYSLTDAGLAARREAIVERLVAGGPPGLRGDRARAERMVSARKENMLGTLRMMRDKYGSVERYVVERLGLPRASVEQIRRNLVVELADGEEPLDWRSHARLLAQWRGLA